MDSQRTTHNVFKGPRNIWGNFSVIGMFYILIMGFRLVPLQKDEKNGLNPKIKLLWPTLHEKTIKKNINNL